MSYTISNVKDDLTGILHGTTLNQVQGVDNLIYRAARKLLNDVDPLETVRIVEIPNAIYDRVYDYQVPADLKGDRVIDIRPQVNRSLADRFFHQYNTTFDLQKESSNFSIGGAFTIQYNSGIKSIRIDKNLIPAILVNDCDSPSSNGLWTGDANVANVTADNVNYVQGNGSIRFDVIGGGNPSIANLTNSTVTSMDLSEDENQGAFFMYVYIPDPDVMIDFSLSWGNSGADYWTDTVDQTQSSTVFQQGWNLLRFDWDGATVTGAPDASDITFLNFTIQYDGTATLNFRIDDITEQLGTIYQIEYYSKFLFRDAITGAFQETVTDNTNIVNLDTESYNLLFNLCAYYAVQQQQGANSSYDASFFLTEYTEGLKQYIARIKSQTINPAETYYRMPRRRTNFKRLPY